MTDATNRSRWVDSILFMIPVAESHLEANGDWNINDWYDVTDKIARYVTDTSSAPDDINSRLYWYIDCFRDVAHGKVVRGLGEAKAGYASALKDVRALIEKEAA